MWPFYSMHFYKTTLSSNICAEIWCGYSYGRLDLAGAAVPADVAICSFGN